VTEGRTRPGAVRITRSTALRHRDGASGRPLGRLAKARSDSQTGSDVSLGSLVPTAKAARFVVPGACQTPGRLRLDAAVVRAAHQRDAAAQGSALAGCAWLATARPNLRPPAMTETAPERLAAAALGPPAAPFLRALAGRRGRVVRANHAKRGGDRPAHEGQRRLPARQPGGQSLGHPIEPQSVHRGLVLHRGKPIQVLNAAIWAHRGLTGGEQGAGHVSGSRSPLGEGWARATGPRPSSPGHSGPTTVTSGTYHRFCCCTGGGSSIAA
jgi:hypothetical protein